MDLGATMHMTHNRSAFRDYLPYSKEVTVASGETLIAARQGTALLKHDRQTVLLCNALHVLGLSNSLVSVPQLTARGFSV